MENDGKREEPNEPKIVPYSSSVWKSLHDLNTAIKY